MKASIINEINIKIEKKNVSALSSIDDISDVINGEIETNIVVFPTYLQYFLVVLPCNFGIYGCLLL